MRVLRLIFNGVFGRFPNVQVIAGHGGEVVLFSLQRTGDRSRCVNGKLKRPLIDCVRVVIRLPDVKGTCQADSCPLR